MKIQAMAYKINPFENIVSEKPVSKVINNTMQNCKADSFAKTKVANKAPKTTPFDLYINLEEKLDKITAFYPLDKGENIFKRTGKIAANTVKFGIRACTLPFSFVFGAAACLIDDYIIKD